ncbi:MAG: hypothetical protein GX038_05925 [Erysipelothrix sp.]|nr:hypothetical protein [Erysipelothrix sp.]
MKNFLIRLLVVVALTVTSYAVLVDNVNVEGNLFAENNEAKDVEAQRNIGPNDKVIKDVKDKTPADNKAGSDIEANTLFEVKNQEEGKDAPSKVAAVKSNDTYTTDVVVVKETIAFQKTTTNDGNLAKGKSVVDVTGVNGQRENKIEIKYKNGTEISRSTVSSTVIKNPVNEVVRIGTKVAAPVKQTCSVINNATELICHINNARIDNGQAPLRVDGTLTGYANVRANEITTLFSHTRPDGTPWYTVGSKAGGENVSFGFSTAASAHKGFMDSAGHRANNLRKEFKTIGVALKIDASGKYHWAVIFGY